MSRNWLKGVQDHYDVVIIGSGLGGLTAANTLGKLGHKVLVLEHHCEFGGLATWFKRKGGHMFDISLHGFPAGMLKSCRKYWTQDITSSIEQIKRIRFVNPQFELETTFDREDFTRILIERFGIPAEQVQGFFDHLRQMNYYDRDARTTRELFDQFFPGRTDVHRLLLEPIAYANGSSQDDPAITYGIVFSNFMSKGVFIFKGGTDLLIKKMIEELESNGVELRKRCLVEKILLEAGPDGHKHAVGVRVNGQEIRSKIVLSNANLKTTLFGLVGREELDDALAAQMDAVRINSGSCQVYFGVREGEHIPDIGDLIFCSEAPEFSSDELLNPHTASRTFSLYYPDNRPHTAVPHYAIVCSVNARWEDWASLSEEDYQAQKDRICQEALVALEKFVPDIRDKLDWIEAATPRTIHRYVRSWNGTSFGTKFEGLKVSMELPERVPGLYHAGSVGIIMSGWLGTMNYGVIVSSKIDAALRAQSQMAAAI